MSLKLVSFRRNDNSDIRPGAMIGSTIIDLCAATDSLSAECAGGVVEMLKNEAALDRAEEVADAVDDLPDAAKLQREDVELLSPVPAPGKVFCLATNYRSHLNESISKKLGGEKTQPDIESPRVFMKPSTNTICGDGAPIAVSRMNAFVDYEGEL
ncbi:MAG: fumarylacetoacetate hydrolase family protein, partial [Armatimonadota bacterium]